MLKYTIVIRGNAEVREKLRRLGSGIYKLKGAMRDIGQDTAAYYAGRAFEQQGTAFNNKWKPLKQEYAARKAQKYPGHGMLVASGTMKNSFTYAASETQVMIGNETDYFKYHQSTKTPRRKMPRRQMMGINEPVKRIVRDAIRKDIRKKMEAI
jgi:phage gpG-like protein